MNDFDQHVYKRSFILKQNEREREFYGVFCMFGTTEINHVTVLQVHYLTATYLILISPIQDISLGIHFKRDGYSHRRILKYMERKKINEQHGIALS